MPLLRELARLVVGEPHAALERLLALACEQLAMDVAVVGVLDESGTCALRASVGAATHALLADAAWCERVVTAGGLLDLTAAYAAVPLRDEHGDAYGVLCASGHGEHPSLNPRDLDVLRTLAEVMEPLVRETDQPVRQSGHEQPGLDAVAIAVEGADDVERLTRPLLEALADLTGMASTYLTVVHDDLGEQEIRYARNGRAGFEMPEGLFVPWHDTLCKRALDEGRPCTTDVPAVWGDSDAARDLGIQVYVSVPVERPDGRLWGTLCAADPAETEDPGAHLATMRLFARLIGAQVEREEALQRARDEAERDPLTGCSARRVVDPWLEAQLAGRLPTEEVVVAYVDLDSFKGINDTWGHAAGDAVLAEVGRRLRGIARPDDLVARIGGDEFLVAARLPFGAAGDLGERVRTAITFTLVRQEGSVVVRGSVGTATSRDHADLPAIVAAADAAMYDAKRTRQPFLS